MHASKEIISPEKFKIKKSSNLAMLQKILPDEANSLNLRLDRLFKVDSYCEYYKIKKFQKSEFLAAELNVFGKQNIHKINILMIPKYY